MFVDLNNLFVLDQYTKDLIRDMEPDFGFDGYGELIFYRTYSRYINDNQETWHDVVIRVIEGCISIRKDFYIKNHISWDEKRWQQIARKVAISMFRMFWLPPGRGLWIMGTKFLYERGSMAAQNCGYLEITNKLGEDMEWLTDALMVGVGIGFSPLRNDSLTFQKPRGNFDYIIPDSREGWATSIRLQIEAYENGTPKPRFIYDFIRPKGEPIKGFGGIASGPEPLIEYHLKIEELIDWFMTDSYYDSVMLKTDLANLSGVMVVSGNCRRSAELGSSSIKDPVFKDLKNYDKYPHRSDFGWMSNNSVDLIDDEDFERLDEVANRVIVRGEPGIKNLRNFPLGRIGKKDKIRRDKGKGSNPCGEQILESKEICNIDETCPTRCPDTETWYKACKYASLYCSTISLLPTHQSVTNRIIARNRRIGVGIIDVSGWKHMEGVNKVTRYLREGYQIVRKTNRFYNGEAGVPEAIRVTTIKPGGTVPKIAGKTAGAGYPTFEYTLRRTRVASNSPFAAFLIRNGVPYEHEKFDPNGTLVFESPILQGPAKSGEYVSLWQQAMDIVWLQREWSDNSVSNTLYFKPKWLLKRSFNNIEIGKEYLRNKLDDYDSYLDALIKIENWEPEFIIEGNKTSYKINLIFGDDDEEIQKINISKFNPTHEEDDIEAVLSTIAPLIKTVSLLPHSSVGAYEQMPEEGITKEEYERRKAQIGKIDWSLYDGKTDGEDERYCHGNACERPIDIGQGTQGT